jgi:predicted ester cyclase
MPETPKQLAIRWFEQVWNQKNEAAIDEMYSATGKSYGFPEPDSILIGPEAFKPLHRTFTGAFPDLHFALDDVIAEGDRVAIRWSVTMTHTGDHLGIPATQKPVTQHGASFLVVRDGQILEGWNEMDMNYLFKQLNP